MCYEEKWENGRLYCRTRSDEPWRLVSIPVVEQRLFRIVQENEALRKRIEELEHE